MDRRQLKNEAKQSVRGARGSTKLTTLVCLLAVGLLALAEWGLTLLAERSAGGSQYLSQALSAQSRSYALVMLVSLVFQFLLILLFAGYFSFALRLSRNEFFSMDVLLDGPEKSVRQIISEAKAINQTHRWQLFVLDLSFLPWLLLCSLTCGVLLIWKLPYLAATYAHAYRHMLDDYAIRQRRMEELLAEQQERFRQNRFF